MIWKVDESFMGTMSELGLRAANAVRETCLRRLPRNPESAEEKTGVILGRCYGRASVGVLPLMLNKAIREILLSKCGNSSMIIAPVLTPKTLMHCSCSRFFSSFSPDRCLKTQFHR